jgi:hypothetical protein
MSLTPFGSPGAGQKQNNALQIPLHPLYHRGRFGIDGTLGATSWEETFGRQVDHLSSTSRRLRYSVLTLAWSWASPLVRRRVERFLQEYRSRCVPP